MQQLTQDQALTLLKQRAEAQDNLITFARVIDIPAVPLDATEDVWSVVDTPLATHHLLTLNALQAMSCGRLLFDPDDLSPITRPTPAGLEVVVTAAQTAPTGRVDGGVALNKASDPSLNPPNEG